MNTPTKLAAFMLPAMAVFAWAYLLPGGGPPEAAPSVRKTPSAPSMPEEYVPVEHVRVLIPEESLPRDFHNQPVFASSINSMDEEIVWAWQYADADAAGIQRAVDAINFIYKEQVMQPLRDAKAMGLLVSTGPVKVVVHDGEEVKLFPDGPADQPHMATVRNGIGYLTILPESEYPELHRMLREMNWLGERLRMLQYQKAANHFEEMGPGFDHSECKPEETGQ